MTSSATDSAIILETTSLQVRSQLIKTLELDLIGAKPDEILSEAPTKWYLSGFLAPYGVPESDRSDDFGDDEIDEISRMKMGDDEKIPEAAAARKSYFSSSMGLSFLIASNVTKLEAIASWLPILLLNPDKSLVLLNFSFNSVWVKVLG